MLNNLYIKFKRKRKKALCEKKNNSECETACKKNIKLNSHHSGMC